MKPVTWISALLFAVHLISGCAMVPTAESQAKQAELGRTIPICIGETDCKAKWEAAQLWIVHNAGYKIQSATSVLIETYNPTQYDTNLAARVTKEPLGGGKYRLVIAVWCNNMFGCTPNALDTALDFNKKISAVMP